MRTLVDVRAFPMSRRNPQFSREALFSTLRDAGIRYEWQGRALGGYRNVPYPEHMDTCAESNPDECHRAHIADWLVARGHRVVHLLSPGRAREHAANPQEDLWQDD